jgi:beta-lactamase class A
MAFALVPELPAHVSPPAVSAPAPREISFGRVAGKVRAGTYRVVVRVDGRAAGAVRVDEGAFDLHVDLPPRDVEVEVVAEDALGNDATTRIDAVLGLPGDAEEVAATTHEDPALGARILKLTSAFGGTSAVYVESLGTGAGAAWNARARFPAASTVKVAIAVETMRILSDRPPENSTLDTLLEAMLVESDNEAANQLLTWIGGSDSGGAASVNRTLEALDLDDTRLYGAFLTASGDGPIPLEVESQPAFAGKYTTAYDLAQLHRDLHLAATGEGPLLSLEGSFAAADARAIIWFLAHSEDTGKLDRLLGRDTVVAHKAGWVSDARHDAGLVYTPDGAFVAAVMTWTGGDAGEASDLLAARVAKAALERVGETASAQAPEAAPFAFAR